MRSTLPGVAPAELLEDDFRLLDAQTTLRCAWETEQSLLVQSVIGHAHEGHGIFRRQGRFVNTTIDDICRALRLDPQAVRTYRQEIIDGVGDYIEGVLRGGEGRFLVDGKNRPLLSMGTLPLLGEVDGKEVLRGFYLGAYRDDSTVRLGAEARYNLVIGGGESFLVNLPRMAAAGLDADRLAHEDHDAKAIAHLRQQGIIEADEGPDDLDTAYLYIRHRRGTGTSDDACILLCGLLHGFGAGVGAFLADAVDTLEKYVPVFGGADRNLAARIEERMPDLNLSRRDVEDIAYLCANENGHVPDSSLRHLLAVDRRHDLCVAESHLLYLKGRPYPPLGVAHERFPNARLYDYCEKRLAEWRGRSIT